MNQKKRQQRDTGRAVWIVGAVIAVVIGVAAIVAISQTGGNNDSAASGVQQYSEITVEGEKLPSYGEGDTDAAVGMTAPIVTGQGFTGNTVTTEPIGPTMLVFLAHWCPHCQREVPLLVQWAASGTMPEGLDVIGVATATSPTNPNFPPSEWLTREKFPPLWPVLADDAKNTAGNAFGVTGYPFFVLMDETGKVVQRISGEISMDELNQVIEATLGL
jgi:cytochrome c biogenesis protein CcmG/thiol:disulfide interchange protein DsbE